MRCFVRYICFVVVFVHFALGHGFAQVQHKCNRDIYKCESGKGCYDQHIEQGWHCPGGDNNPEWAKFANVIGEWTNNISPYGVRKNGKICTGYSLFGLCIGGVEYPYDYYEHRIDKLNNANISIGSGDAFLFTDDGGVWGNYSDPTPSGSRPSYQFRIKSKDGLPLRFKVYEMAVRQFDSLRIFEVKRDGGVETITERKLYGRYRNYAQGICDGYSHCRHYGHESDFDDIEFAVESGEAIISWKVGYPSTGGSKPRVGWVMVIGVLSAKVKGISLSEVAECKPDNIAVAYDVYVGAKNKNAKNVQFHIENEATGLVLDTTVFNVNSTNNPNTMTFNSKRLGGAGNYKVRINSISDDWSTENVSSSVSGTVSLRVKPKPTVIIKDTTMCSREMGAVVLKADGLDASYKFEVQAMDKSNNWVNIGTSTQMGRYELGVLEWDSNPNLQVVTNLYNTSYKYQVKVTNYDSYGIEQCNSGWYEYNVNVIKQPETGPQYHIPN